MIEALYQQLAIPATCFLGKRVYKKLFYENTALTVTDKKVFSEAIDDIQWRYSLKPETINIARFQDEERDYSEVAFLQVNLKDKKHYKRLAQIIQRAIPYPLLIVFSQSTSVAFAVADKRISRADADKMTVEAFYETDWLDLENLNEIEQAFIDSCAIRHLSFQNFYAFYADLTARIIAFNCARLSGQFTLESLLSREQRIENLNALRQAQQKLTELKAALKKESQFNRQVGLNVQIKQLTQAIERDKAGI